MANAYLDKAEALKLAEGNQLDWTAESDLEEARRLINWIFDGDPLGPLEDEEGE